MQTARARAGKLLTGAPTIATFDTVKVEGRYATLRRVTFSTIRFNVIALYTAYAESSLSK